MEYLSIPHYRGLKEKYDEQKHSDGIFFTTDTHEIIANNATYGETIDTWSIADGVLTLTMTSGKTLEITFDKATESAKGFLSAEDKKKINSLEGNFDKKVDKVPGKSLVDDTEIDKLSNLPNKADLDSAIADAKKAGTDAQTNLTSHIGNKENPHEVTKVQVGLGNVTNDAQVKRSEMGAASGVATLDENGLVPSSQLPSFVDDVLEFDLKDNFPTTGETGKIYVSTDTNLTYRWTGTQYTKISTSIALGETSSTAYPGDKGKAATDNINKVKSTALSHIDDTTPVTYSASKVTVNYECYEGDQYGSAGTKHGADIAAASETAAGVMTAADKSKLNAIESGAQKNTVTGVKGNSESSYRTGNINITKTNIGLGNVDNTSDADKPVSTAQQTALNKKVDKTYVDEQLETKADKTDVDEQRISYVSSCFADCTETHEAKLKSITLAASVIPSKAIFSITLKIANNLTLLNQSPVYMHLVDISDNVIGVSQNAVKQVQNNSKYVTWFFDSAINTTGESFVIKLYTTNSASDANDNNSVCIIAHVSQDEDVEGIGVTSDDGTYHMDWTPAIGINVVNLAAIYPQIKELQKYRMAYATSELPDISTRHNATINEIRISQTTMGISLVSSVSLMVADDNVYTKELYLKVCDINGNLVAKSKNSVNLSQNLGAYVTWYFTPFQLIDDVIYRFAAYDYSGNKHVMRIHVASGKNEGVTCFDQNNSPHTDYCPALGMNVSAIFANDLYKNINEINLALGNEITNVEANLANEITKLNNTTSTINSHVTNFQNPHQTNKSQIGLSNVTNDAQVKRSEMGANNGVATLDDTGKVLSSQLPSYVDEILEFQEKDSFPEPGESGKIYVELTSNLTYRWSGTQYVEISPSIGLGETSSTAYAGDKGKDLANKVNNKVDKVTGKNLSTNDFTNELKQTLEDLNSWNYIGILSSWTGISKLTTISTESEILAALTITPLRGNKINTKTELFKILDQCAINKKFLKESSTTANVFVNYIGSCYVIYILGNKPSVLNDKLVGTSVLRSITITANLNETLAVLKNPLEINLEDINSLKQRVVDLENKVQQLIEQLTIE